MEDGLAAIYLANPIDVDNRLEVLGWNSLRPPRGC